jgi:hypothetical protein
MAASSDHSGVKRALKRAISRVSRLFVAVGIIVGELRRHPIRFLCVDQTFLKAMKLTPSALAMGLITALTAVTAVASSHREAPGITNFPKVDGTDLYMFRSYEPGREGFVTFIANYQPLQDPGGGPNYFLMDDKASYKINIDNNGDGVADIVLDFNFFQIQRDLKVQVNGVPQRIPLVAAGPFGDREASDTQNTIEGYQLYVTAPGVPRALAANPRNSSTSFIKPFDNIGKKTIPQYRNYSEQFVYRTQLPGCATEAKVFVGQRREGFAVNLGEVFDLINTNPLGPPNAEPSDTFAKNVTSLAVEVPISCLTNAANPSPIIGAWTTASVPNALGPDQVSRLSAPLVNELIIGLADKNKFNASSPAGDSQFASYVTNPTMPVIIESLFPSAKAPTRYPRTDLVQAFLTGVPGLNQPTGVTPAEMMRLNTSIAPVVVGSQSNLGVLGGDTAGFPNGRRPGDDVVDIELRVLEGALLPAAEAPAGALPFTDGATTNSTYFRAAFPYLTTPLPGSPNVDSSSPAPSDA